MPPGKQVSQNEAAAATAAGARLEAMRRRVRLSRVAVWAVIAAGPIALAVALTSLPARAEATPAAPPIAVRSTAAAVDPGGYAQVFMNAWLRSSAEDETSAHARLAKSIAPDVSLPTSGLDAQSLPESVSVVRSVQRAHGAWAATVAAQYPNGPVRYYTVPVASDSAGASFTVTGAPAMVAGPARATTAKPSYTVIVPQGDLSSAVSEFLAAYLTGAGEIDRYLAPGAKLTAVLPTPYTSVSVEQVLAAEKATAANQGPADGTSVRVLARVEAQNSVGRWPLAYEFTLTARSGRWEVATLESGTARDGGTR
ncbi:conjugal transfer protein [Streptomyces crystallinus]|uniref:Conjugal transfer protein n=1 Tax=Streptomyces crystallinus TaxID=68191 RepID=A0ABN1GHB2_9ACTN